MKKFLSLLLALIMCLGMLPVKGLAANIEDEADYAVNAYKKTENGFVKLGGNDALHILKNNSGDTTADIYIQLTDKSGEVIRLYNNQVMVSSYPTELKVIDNSYVAVDESGDELKADEKGVYVKAAVKVVDTDNTETGNLGQITFKAVYDNNEYYNDSFSYRIYYHEIIDNFDLKLMKWVHNNVYEESGTNEVTFEKPAIDSNEKIYFAFFKNDDINYFEEDYFTFKKIKSSNNAPEVTVNNLTNKSGFFEADIAVAPDTKAGEYTYELEFDTTDSGNKVLGECYTVTAEFTVVIKDADYKIIRIDESGEPLTVEKGGESKALIFKVLKDGEDFDVYDNGYILSIEPDDCQGFFINDSFEASSESYRAVVTAYLQGTVGKYPVKVQLKKAGNDSVLAENTINVNVIELPDDTPMPKRSDIKIEGEYFYTGNLQTVLVNGYMPSKMYISNSYKDEPGKYNVTVSLKAGYEWADGGTDPVELKWVINKKALKAPVLAKRVFEYTGEEIDVTKYLTGFDSDIMYTTEKTKANAISGGYYFGVSIIYSDYYTFIVDGNEVYSVRFSWKIVNRLTEHEITVTNGTAAPAKAKEGEIVTVKATVPNNKEFVKWTTETDGIIFANELDKETTFEMPDKNVNITAELKDKVKHTVTAYGLYGSTIGITPGKVFTAECMENEKVILQIGGRSGYKLKGLTLEGISESDITWYSKEQDNDHRGIDFSMPDGDVTVTVNWEKIESKSSGSGGGGSAAASYEIATVNSDNGTTTTDKKDAKKGDTVTITAKPKDGYELDKVTVKDSNGKEIEVKDLGNGKFSFVMPSGKVSINAEYRETAKETNDKPALKFKDVKEEDYFYNAVLWAVENGVTSGITDELFGSDDNCTRAHAITFLWRAMGCPEPASTDSKFTDVIGESYYEKAVLWAVEKGITSGISDTMFAPDAYLTRAQIVAFLWRLAGCPTAETKAGFGDIAEDSYYIDALNWAVEKGIVYGISETKFGSDVMCSRAQIITFIMRYNESVK